MGWSRPDQLLHRVIAQQHTSETVYVSTQFVDPVNRSEVAGDPMKSCDASNRLGSLASQSLRKASSSLECAGSPTSAQSVAEQTRTTYVRPLVATGLVFRRRGDRILQVENHRGRAHLCSLVEVTGFVFMFVPSSIRSAG
jgi:hypothetical protein